MRTEMNEYEIPALDWQPIIEAAEATGSEIPIELLIQKEIKETLDLMNRIEDSGLGSDVLYRDAYVHLQDLREALEHPSNVIIDSEIDALIMEEMTNDLCAHNTSAMQFWPFNAVDWQPAVKVYKDSLKRISIYAKEYYIYN